MSGIAKVSVVIPTFRRPASVAKAIGSVLEQTVKPFEVIVVSDGPDPEVEEVARSFNDPTVRVFCLATNKGAGAARNKGIEKATGDYIAFLDDDDIWYREKLKRQLEIVETAKEVNVLVGCLEERIFADGRKSVYPSVMPVEGETVMHYQFYPDKQGRSKGVHTSTWFGSVGLFRETPFREGLPRHQDWQWIIDSYQFCSPKILMVWKVLAAQNVPPRHARRSAVFEYTYGWYKENKENLPSYARCSILGFVAKKVGSEGSRSELFRFARELWRQGCVSDVGGIFRLGGAMSRGIGGNVVRKVVRAWSRMSGRFRND